MRWDVYSPLNKDPISIIADSAEVSQGTLIFVGNYKGNSIVVAAYAPGTWNAVYIEDFDEPFTTAYVREAGRKRLFTTSNRARLRK